MVTKILQTCQVHIRGLARQKKRIAFVFEMDNYYDVQMLERDDKVAIMGFFKTMRLDCGLAKKCHSPRWWLA
jgi:hypothetical protein